MLLDEIAAARVEFTAAATAQDAASAAVSSATPTGLAAAQQAFQQADAAVTTAKLKLDTLEANYTQIQQSNSGGIGLTVFSPAQPLGSDRRSVLQLYVIGALLLGGLLGLALATLSANHWQLIQRPEEPEPAA